MTLLAWMFQLAFVLALADSEAIECGANQVWIERLGSCCGQCEPGAGVILPCTSANDTVCHACLTGHYSAVRSYELSCELCSNCPKHSHPVHRCNATHNTKCECDRNFHYDSHRRLCQPCSQCKHGWGVKTLCDAYRDTTCEPCPSGSFSDVFNGVAGCTACRKCPQGHTVKLQCSNIQDTVCQDSLGYIAARKNGSALDGADISGDSTQQRNIIPYYCAALGVVLVALIGYVVIKRWRLISCSKRGQPVKIQKTASPAVSDHHHNRNRNLLNNNSGKNSSEIIPILVTNDTLVRDLPGGLRRELEIRLGQSQDESKNWVALAKHLGYSGSKIRSLAEAAGSPVKSAAQQIHISSARGQQGAKAFLSDWGADGATLNQLVVALAAVKRDDIAQTLVNAANSRSTWTPIDIV